MACNSTTSCRQSIPCIEPTSNRTHQQKLPESKCCTASSVHDSTHMNYTARIQLITTITSMNHAMKLQNHIHFSASIFKTFPCTSSSYRTKELFKKLSHAYIQHIYDSTYTMKSLFCITSLTKCPQISMPHNISNILRTS